MELYLHLLSNTSQIIQGDVTYDIYNGISKVLNKDGKIEIIQKKDGDYSKSSKNVEDILIFRSREDGGLDLLAGEKILDSLISLLSSK